MIIGDLQQLHFFQCFQITQINALPLGSITICESNLPPDCIQVVFKTVLLSNQKNNNNLVILQVGRVLTVTLKFPYCFSYSLTCCIKPSQESQHTFRYSPQIFWDLVSPRAFLFSTQTYSCKCQGSPFPSETQMETNGNKRGLDLSLAWYI